MSSRTLRWANLMFWLLERGPHKRSQYERDSTYQQCHEQPISSHLILPNVRVLAVLLGQHFR